MNNQQELTETSPKKISFSAAGFGFAALIILTVICSIYYVGFEQGKHQDKYFGPNSCRAAFTTIADQLDGAKDSTASAIRGLDTTENKDVQIKRLVGQCLGELPTLKESPTAATTTVAPTTVKP